MIDGIEVQGWYQKCPLFYGQKPCRKHVNLSLSTYFRCVSIQLTEWNLNRLKRDCRWVNSSRSCCSHLNSWKKTTFCNSKWVCLPIRAVFIFFFLFERETLMNLLSLKQTLTNPTPGAIPANAPRELDRVLRSCFSDEDKSCPSGLCVTLQEWLLGLCLHPNFDCIWNKGPRC